MAQTLESLFSRMRGSVRNRFRLRRLQILRLGFGAMIVLLMLAALETWRILETSIRQTDEIYRRHVHTLNVTSRIRRLIYQGSILARDYFLSNQPNRRDTFDRQIAQLRAESVHVMKEFDRSVAPEDQPAKLREQVDAFWSSLSTTTGSPRLSTAAEAYEFLQSEIVPRRNSAGVLLRELEVANERALRQGESEFRSNRRNALFRLFAVVGLCILVAAAVARLSLRHAERSELESAIRFEESTQARRELQRLSARLLQVQEDERSSLSREMHDEIGQTLTALRIEISRALASLRTQPYAAEESLLEARLLAERTVAAVRNISLLLRPSLLDDLGLEPALQSLVEEINRRGGFLCDFSCDGIEAELPDRHRTCIYRVVQEALTNCARHSGARSVSVHLWQDGDRLHLEVRDDGKGFLTGPHGAPKGRSGLGILGMRERVGVLGGELKLESSPGRGTCVSASLPLTAGSVPEGERDVDHDPAGG